MDEIKRVFSNVFPRDVAAVEPGGSIFVGDIRSLPLLRALHASVELEQAAPSLSTEEFERQVQKRMEQEEELVIDPRFFAWLPTALSKIGRVQVQLKRGSFTNELNAFRYDVTIYVGDGVERPTGGDWLPITGDWDGDVDEADGVGIYNKTTGTMFLVDDATQGVGAGSAPADYTIFMDPTGGAMWYHADFVKPAWRSSLTEGHKIGRHIFYHPN